MPRGPLPSPNRRRRNAPTIPTTDLPARGRSEPAPDPPASSDLGGPGRAWWEWAWSTPQAAGWSAGDLFTAARRASLEDDLATIAKVDGLDTYELLAAEDMQDVRAMVGRLAALVTGKLAIYRAALELDDRLGLTPKALAQLRWSIVEDDAGEQVDEERPLATMTVKDLRALARARKVPVGAGTRKVDLLALLGDPPAVVNLADERRRRLTANAP